MAEGKKVEDIGQIIVKLVDKGGIFNDPLQSVSLTNGRRVAKVRLTPTVQQGLKRGAIVKTDAAELERWEKERAEYVKKAELAATNKKAEQKAANTTSAEKLKTVSAQNEELKKQVKKQATELEKAEKALEDLNKKLEEVEGTNKKK